MKTTMLGAVAIVLLGSMSSASPQSICGKIKKLELPEGRSYAVTFESGQKVEVGNWVETSLLTSALSADLTLCLEPTPKNLDYSFVSISK